MKPLAELSPTQILDRVQLMGACHNDNAADPKLFQAAPYEAKAQLAKRQEGAAKFCGQCSARSACREYARQRGKSAADHSIYGGLFFTGKRVVDIITGDTIPNSEFFVT